MLVDKFSVQGISGVQRVIKHKIRLKFTLGEQNFSHVFYVLETADIQFLLGADFLAEHEIVFDYGTKLLKGPHFTIPLVSMNKMVNEVLFIDDLVLQPMQFHKIPLSLTQSE